MKKKNIINSILQNTRMPEGFFGRIILRGMNKGQCFTLPLGALPNRMEIRLDDTRYRVRRWSESETHGRLLSARENIRYRYILRKRKIRSKGNQETAEYSLLYLAGKRNEPTL